MLRWAGALTGWDRIADQICRLIIIDTVGTLAIMQDRGGDMFRIALAAAAAALVALSTAAAAADGQLDRGKYLVTIAGCNDCHTPGYFFGKPDMDRYLGGSDVGFEIPGLGVFVGRNITPDKETGIGSWSMDQIVTALTTGKRPDGRELAPIMPWHAFAHLQKADVDDDRRLPPEPEAGEAQDPRPVRPRGKGVDLHVPCPAARRDGGACTKAAGEVRRRAHAASWKMMPSVWRVPERSRLTPWRIVTR